MIAKKMMNKYEERIDGVQNGRSCGVITITCLSLLLSSGQGRKGGRKEGRREGGKEEGSKERQEEGS